MNPLDKRAQTGDTPVNDLDSLPSQHEFTPEDTKGNQADNELNEEEEAATVDDTMSLGIDPTKALYLKLDGEEVEVTEIYSSGYLPMLEVSGQEYYVAPDSVIAGAAAREYWSDVMSESPETLGNLLGEDRLTKWALGEADSEGISNAKEFLALMETTPEKEFDIDSSENSGLITEAVVDKLGMEFRVHNGWAECVIYKGNLGE